MGCCAGLGRRLHVPRVKATIGLIVAGPYFASALVLVETLSLFLSKQHLGFLQPCLAKTVSRFIFIILKFNYVYGGGALCALECRCPWSLEDVVHLLQL